MERKAFRTRRSAATNRAAADGAANDRAARDPVASALQIVRAMVGAVGKTARRIEERTGITNAQLFLLHEIAASPDLSVNELAERAMTHQSTASLVLSRLERRGLVERARSPDDGRRVVLRLSSAGRRLVRRSPPPATYRLIAALRRLDPAELRALTRGLRALGREFGFSDERPPILFQDSTAGANGNGPGGGARPARRSRPR